MILALTLERNTLVLIYQASALANTDVEIQISLTNSKSTKLSVDTDTEHGFTLCGLTARLQMLR